MDWSSQLPFKVLCDFLQRLVSTERTGRVKRLERFLERCRAVVAEKGRAGDSLFPVMRLLLPQLDKERGAYKIKVRFYVCM